MIHHVNHALAFPADGKTYHGFPRVHRGARDNIGVFRPNPSDRARRIDYKGVCHN